MFLFHASDQQSTDQQSVDSCISRLNPLSTDTRLSSPQESKLLPEHTSPTKRKLLAGMKLISYQQLCHLRVITS